MTGVSGTRTARCPSADQLVVGPSTEVIAGNGPCNRERLADRREAHADGAWVRDAALAHAAKRRTRLAA